LFKFDYNTLIAIVIPIDIYMLKWHKRTKPTWQKGSLL